MAESPNTALLFEDGDLVLPDRVVPDGAVLVSGRKILAAGPVAEVEAALNARGQSPGSLRRISADGGLICPALWEVHIHGCGGFATDHASPDALVGMGRFLARQGVGGFVPTTIADPAILDSLSGALSATSASNEGGASGPPIDSPDLRGRIPGIYVEGPFVSAAKKGGIDGSTLRAPSAAVLDEILAKGRGSIRVMTLAPELPGSRKMLDRLVSAGIIPALGHSDARLSDLAAFENVSPLIITHLFNGMSGVSHKEPGLAHWALLDRNVYTELNCDGVHVHPSAISLTFRTRPHDRIVLISDAISPAGLAASETEGFTLYGKPIEVKGAGVHYADSGQLVGSRYLVRDCVAQLVAQGQAPLHEAVAMASLNPAKMLGLTTKGALLPGWDADVAIMSRDFAQCRLLAWEGRVLFDLAMDRPGL